MSPEIEPQRHRCLPSGCSQVVRVSYSLRALRVRLEVARLRQMAPVHRLANPAGIAARRPRLIALGHAGVSETRARRPTLIDEAMPTFLNDNGSVTPEEAWPQRSRGRAY